MKKNTILTSITAMALVVPALADPVTPNIAVGTNPADCTEPVLGTTSGTSNLEANWNANTLYLSWSVDGQPYATNDSNAAACTYDRGITIPTNPTKTGYTFAGWTVKAPQCNLRDVVFEENPIDYNYVQLNGTGICMLDGWDDKDRPIYTCSNKEDTELYGIALKNGEWQKEHLEGLFEGASYCSAKSGDDHDDEYGGNSADWTATESELTSASGEKKYCWCKPTVFRQRTWVSDGERAAGSDVFLISGRHQGSSTMNLNCFSALSSSGNGKKISFATPETPQLLEGVTSADVDFLTGKGCTVVTGNTVVPIGHYELSQCSINLSLWLFNEEEESAEECMSSCASSCANTEFYEFDSVKNLH